MKRICQLALAAALLGAPAAAQAQCCGSGYGYGYQCWDGWVPLPAYALIQRPHPQANLFPYGGWTLYPGEAGSGVPSLSHYSHVYGIKPPAAYAADVEAKLHSLGIPRKAPEPKYLGRNPAIDLNVEVPTPKSLLPKDEPKEEEGTVEPPPLPRSKPKDKDEDEIPKVPSEKEMDKDKDKGKKPEKLDKPNVEKDKDKER
jgi:hypothetical protein